MVLQAFPQSAWAVRLGLALVLETRTHRNTWTSAERSGALKML